MKLKITVHGVAYEVDVEVLEGQSPANAPVPLYVAPIVHPSHAAPAAHHAAAPQPKLNAEDVNGIISPVAGTVTDVKCKAGDAVKRGEIVVVVDAMKMETNIAADKDAVVRKVAVKAGDAIREGQILIEYE